VPYKPSLVTAITNSSDAMIIIINKPESGEVETYSINCSPSVGDPVNVTCSENVTRTTLSGLTGGTIYNISVMSCSQGVCSTEASTARNTTCKLYV